MTSSWWRYGKGRRRPGSSAAPPSAPWPLPGLLLLLLQHPCLQPRVLRRLQVPRGLLPLLLPLGLVVGRRLPHRLADVGELLPVPGTQDPLLLHWFGEQLPWLLRDVQELPEALADLGHVHPLTTLPVDHEAIAGFAPPPDKDAGTTAAIAITVALMRKPIDRKSTV